MNRRRLPLLLAVFALLAACGPSLAVRASNGPGGPRSVAAPLDLAAIVPAPADLGDAFVNSGAQFYPLTYFTAIGHPLAKDLAAKGFAGSYDAGLSVVDPNDPLTELQNVRVVIDVFGSAADASDYLAELAIPSGWSTVTSTLAVGDDVTVLEGSGTNGGRSYTARSLRYHVGAVQFTLTLTNYGEGSPDGLPLTDAGLSTLAKAVNHRLAAVQADAFGGIEPMILRLGEESTLYTSSYEAYLILDGVYTPRYGVTEENFAKLKSLTKGALDDYEAVQAVGEANAPYALTTHIYRFEDEASANAFLANAKAAMPSTGYSSVKEETNAPGFGDASIAFTYRKAASGNAPAVAGERIFARVGALVVSLALEDVQAPPASATETLMTEQLACVAAGACPNPVPLPS